MYVYKSNLAIYVAKKNFPKKYLLDADSNIVRIVSVLSFSKIISKSSLIAGAFIVFVGSSKKNTLELL